jgi:thioredoxin 1
MASENIKTLTATAWETEVLQAAGPVLVDFWAPWCGPCRRVAPVLEDLAVEYAGRLTIGKLQISYEDFSPIDEETTALQVRYEVQSIPAMILFNGGQVVTQIVGALPKEKLQQLLEQHI